MTVRHVNVFQNAFQKILVFRLSKMVFMILNGQLLLI